jgi:hypothetical protein
LIRGFSFNAGEWNFPDAPLRGHFAWHRWYQSACGIESFESWLARVEQKMPKSLMEEIYSEILPEWHDFDPDALGKMLEQLRRKRKFVRGLIIAA